MRSVTTTLARLLFVSQAPASELMKSPDRTRELIHETTDRLGPDAPALALAAVAWEYGRHPETAAAHLRTCLQAVEAAGITSPVPPQRAEAR